MKTYKILTLLFCFLLCAENTFAQKNGKDKTKPNKVEKNGKTTTKPKTKKELAAQKSANEEAKLAGINEMSREEKNTMVVCPLHRSRMSLSDNYRANASDFSLSEGHPFAKQLNYRRCCDKCTKVMIKEERMAQKAQKQKDKGATFQRCEIHNVSLELSGDYSATSYEKFPDSETPHAKQYKFKTYCKTCSKIHDQKNKTLKADNNKKSK
jgi:hypothetical protein